MRACGEIQGTFALTIQGRGDESVVSAGGTDFLSSECVSCGACVQACPTSALSEKSVVDLGMPTRSVETTCAYCGVGCTFRAEVQGEGDDTARPQADEREGHGQAGHAYGRRRAQGPAGTGSWHSIPPDVVTKS